MPQVSSLRYGGPGGSAACFPPREHLAWATRDLAGQSMDDRPDITGVLAIANEGDPDALVTVLTLLHDRLRVIARRQLAGEGEGHTLETDGLVHEAFIRLLGMDRMLWHDRQHLLAMAARTMRRVLIDYAVRRGAQKRGGGVIPVELDEAVHVIDDHADELQALDEALERLAAFNPRYSRVVECRFFAGLSIEETAEVLSTSPATVKRDWAAARAWLNRELAA